MTPALTPAVPEGAMRVRHLRQATAGRLATAGADAELRVAALLFANPAVGLVVVCDGDGLAAGVLSKTDLVRHLATSKSNEARVTALMSQSIISCSPEDDLHSTWRTMSEQNLQNIPVLDAASRPVGVLDVRDALKALLEQEEIQEHMLADYIAGIGYR